MFNTIANVLTAAEIEELRAIASRATFIDGRISAPDAPLKNNRVVGNAELLGRSSQLVAEALYRNEDFRAFTFPKAMAQPVLTRYATGMYYGSHVDAAFMRQSSRMLRSDISCTVFVNDPASYDGGELVARLGTSEVRLRGPAGSALLYPSTMIHRVEEVTRGERLVVLTFIESRVAETEKRELLYELGEVGAKAAQNLDVETWTRFQRVQENLLRLWGDPD